MDITRHSITAMCVTVLTNLKLYSTRAVTVRLTNTYAVQQDTQSVLMSEFYSSRMLARHVSDLTGPSSGAFCTSCIRRFGMW